MFKIIDIVGGLLLVMVIVIVISFKKRKIVKLDTRYFKKEWLKIQKKCINKKLWCEAIVDADDLLDAALKKKKTKGKTKGERIVAAQRLFTANDSLWYSHKLANKIADEQLTKISKKDTLKALSAFRQALLDVGALPIKRLRTSK